MLGVLLGRVNFFGLGGWILTWRCEDRVWGVNFYAGFVYIYVKRLVVDFAVSVKKDYPGITTKNHNI